ncbi:hypothetical protein ZWY2020_026840 [Hordeum vulgare]|nr:hypothetical protein ZWY2020_026840 [Hordeum vulgare]
MAEEDLRGERRQARLGLSASSAATSPSTAGEHGAKRPKREKRRPKGNWREIRRANTAGPGAASWRTIHRRVLRHHRKQPPPPREVVQLYRSKGITNMRIYSVQLQAIRALHGSGIRLMLGTTNNDVAVLAGSLSAATSWVHANVKPYHSAGVTIRYIAVGNEITGGAAQSILAAMRNLNKALAAARLSSIKVSTAVRFDVITNSFPPSAAVFAQPYMVDIARHLASTNAPLLANVYPFAYISSPRDIKLNYATLRPGTTVRDNGNGLTYTSLFDAMVDSIYAALEKAGTPNVRVVVSESGWPSAGGFAATPENARAYNQGLIDHVAHGTPKSLDTWRREEYSSKHEELEVSQDSEETLFMLDDGAYLTPAQEMKSLEKVEEIKFKPPFYVAIMSKSTVCQRGSQNNPMLRFGSQYTAKYFVEKFAVSHDRGKHSGIYLLLRLEGKIRSWPTKLQHSSRGSKVLKGWPSFARDNRLREGDLCLFKLMKNEEPLMMMVYIVRR